MISRQRKIRKILTMIEQTMCTSVSDKTMLWIFVSESPVRLMHGYFFRPVDDRRNGNENIVHDSREQKAKARIPNIITMFFTSPALLCKSSKGLSV